MYAINHYDFVRYRSALLQRVIARDTLLFAASQGPMRVLRKFLTCRLTGACSFCSTSLVKTVRISSSELNPSNTDLKNNLHRSNSLASISEDENDVTLTIDANGRVFDVATNAASFEKIAIFLAFILSQSFM
jgi:hypothetical protein